MSLTMDLNYEGLFRLYLRLYRKDDVEEESLFDNLTDDCSLVDVPYFKVVSETGRRVLTSYPSNVCLT